MMKAFANWLLGVAGVVLFAAGAYYIIGAQILGFEGGTGDTLERVGSLLGLVMGFLLILRAGRNDR